MRKPDPLTTCSVRRTLVAALALASGCASPSTLPPVTRSSTQLVEGRLECDLVFQLGEEPLSASFGGELTLSNDEASIVEMAPGAYLVVEQLEGTQRRRSEWRRGEDGSVVVDDLVGRRRVVGEAGREAWRRAILATLVGTTDLGGRARRARFSAPGGTTAILDHLEYRTEGRFALDYLPLILEDRELEDSALSVVAQRAARVAPSSTALAVLLCGIAERAPADERLTSALFTASASLRSSSARSEVLVSLLEERQLAAAQLERLIAQAGALETAASVAYVLSAILEQAPACSEWAAAWLAAARRGLSDAMRAELYAALLGRPDCDAAVRLELAREISGLPSASSRADLACRLAPWAAMEPQLFEQTLELVARLSSDTERARCLGALLANQELSTPELHALGELAGAMSESSDRSRLQAEILERLAREE